jgi:hypothetical protein
VADLLGGRGRGVAFDDDPATLDDRIERSLPHAS